MAKVAKVIELLSQSSKSWEDAIQSAVNEASKTLRNIRSIYIKEFTAEVEKRESQQLSYQRQSHFRSGTRQIVMVNGES